MQIAMRRSMLMVGVLVMAAGCQQPPKGESTGRVDITDTTRAERESHMVMPVALQEQADQVAAQLAADLAVVPEFNEGYRVTVVFGDIVNKTGIVPTSDFEAFRSQVRQNLMQSRAVMKNIRWIENRSRWEQARRREGGQGQDLLQEGSGGRTLNEAYTYFLNGEMYRVNRGGTGRDAVNMYMMSYNLTKMSDGEIIWSSSPYQVKQVR